MAPTTSSVSTRPFARSYRRYRRIMHHTGGVSYTPRDWAKIYNFPPTLAGDGYTIGFIELGGGFKQADLDAYAASLGLPTRPAIQFVPVDGGTNSPSTPDSADGEVMLDLCVAAGLAPYARLRVYMAPNTEQGFLDAVAKAIADNVDAVSISWGAPEDSWSASAMQQMNALFQKASSASRGISVTVASGDNGSGDGESGNHVDFPASSPWVTACGGTSLVADPVSGAVTSETVWNDSSGGATGGGVSSVFSIPDYQVGAGVPNGNDRGVPDISADASPETGVVVRVDGQTLVMGGTSAIAPFMAAMAVVLSQGLGRRVGFLNPILYKLGYSSGLGVPAPLRDVTAGNNGTYTARHGWDACTGVGVPNVAAILVYLQGGIGTTAPPTTAAPTTTTQPPPSPTSTQSPTTSTRTWTSTTPSPDHPPSPTILQEIDAIFAALEAGLPALAAWIQYVQVLFDQVVKANPGLLSHHAARNDMQGLVDAVFNLLESAARKSVAVLFWLDLVQRLVEEEIRTGEWRNPLEKLHIELSVKPQP